MRLPALLLTLCSTLAFAQYNELAGHNAPAPTTVEVRRSGPDGRVTVEKVKKEVTRDSYGNAAGANYDLAVDGAFGGQTVMIVDLYNQNMEAAITGIKRKGFSVVHYHSVPSLKEFSDGLAKSNQFWVIASCDNTVHLSKEHQKAVKNFFDAGHGVYLWGDNDPCNADADSLATMLLDARVKGDIPGDAVVSRSDGAGKPGIVRDHLLSTGVENVYEGITVATVTPAGQHMTPVIYGSAGNLITAAFESGGKRLLVDGGYTRLSYKWDSAGTGRYVTNAAAWLANYERFGNAVVADTFKKKQ